MTPHDLLRGAGDLRDGLREAYKFVTINTALIDELADLLLAAEPEWWAQFDL